ncbi:MAG: acetate kinase [Oscillospiraceae bacterium]|nr:acetate kinase [Oscillospiraceae bacterium]
MNVLVVNAGSSSLKYQLFDMEKREVMARGVCERIGLDGKIKHVIPSRREFVVEKTMDDHADAVQAVIDLLLGEETGVLRSLGDIAAVGHRVVHGGETFAGSVCINDDVLTAVEDCVHLAPLHNPPSLVGIRACARVMDGVKQVAVFDTAFHQTMPPVAYIYALPYDYYERLHVRRYGFHGTSHRYVSERAAKILGGDPKKLKIITCHLGNGSSIAAVKGGQSVDTSMGFTPLEGVPMGTRSGTVDPAILSFLAKEENLSLSDVTDVLNQNSGMLGISGVSSDFRDLEDATANGNERAELALSMFAYAVKKHVGMYAAVLNGVDALVFTAGVGENNAGMRRRIAGELTYMGLEMDEVKNSDPGPGEQDISTAGSRGRILLIPTNEELLIALDTAEIVRKNA